MMRYKRVCRWNGNWGWSNEAWCAFCSKDLNLYRLHQTATTLNHVQQCKKYPYVHTRHTSLSGHFFLAGFAISQPRSRLLGWNGGTMIYAWGIETKSTEADRKYTIIDRDDEESSGLCGCSWLEFMLNKGGFTGLGWNWKNDEIRDTGYSYVFRCANCYKLGRCPPLKPRSVATFAPSLSSTLVQRRYSLFVLAWEPILRFDFRSSTSWHLHPSPNSKLERPSHVGISLYITGSDW